MNNSFKISVKNGKNTISFELKNIETESIDKEAIFVLSSEIISELENLNNTNTKLKTLGYKGNFFKFTLGRKCILSVEAITETENFTLVKSLEFSFGKLEQLSDPEAGLRVILGATVNRRNTLVIC
jgi:hypothetical protein